MTRSDPATDATGAALMLAPRVLVERIAAAEAVVSDPDAPLRLQLSRPVYELLLRFRRPRWVDEVLPAEPERRAAAEACLRYLRARGLLAPPATLLPPRAVRALEAADLPDGAPPPSERLFA